MSKPGNADLSFAVNAERFTGFAAMYNTHRPEPPKIICDILMELAQAAAIEMVVDLGCGTGLSTRIWVDRARQIIGVDPSEDMRTQARQQTPGSNITYQTGLSHATGLPNRCADIVTCSQSLHWMEPQGTFREAVRILRAGGVFAAIDCDWPPTTSRWELDLAYTKFMEHISQIETQRNLSDGLKRWSKDQHLSRMQASGCFRYVKEIAVHSVETGDADRYVGLAMSQGSLQTVLKAGVGENEIGLAVFRETARQLLGSKPHPWYFTYRVRVGVV